jgi:hypothetical protein
MANELDQSQSRLIKEIFAQLAPILQNTNIPPDRLVEAMREAQKPYVDPAQIARNLRERAESQRQFKEQLLITQQMQDQCPHLDAQEKTTIRLQHNFPDRSPRGICVLCHGLIEPARWVIPGAGFDGGNGLGVPYIEPEHRLYFKVRQIQSYS